MGQFLSHVGEILELEEDELRLGVRHDGDQHRTMGQFLSDVGEILELEEDELRLGVRVSANRHPFGDLKKAHGTSQNFDKLNNCKCLVEDILSFEDRSNSIQSQAVESAHLDPV
jgi:hypothetical protein